MEHPESNEGHVEHATRAGFPLIDDTKEVLNDVRDMMPSLKKLVPAAVRLVEWFEGSWLAKLLGYKKG